MSLTFSLAPSYAWWFAPYCLAGLFILLSGTRPRFALLLGFSFGLGWFSSGLWWLYTALNTYSEAGPLFSAALVSTLVLYLSIFPACATGIITLLQPAKSASSAKIALAMIATAGIWTWAEWLRGTLFGGLPWLTSGYAQTSGPLTGYAPIIGVYGLCFVTAVIAILLSRCLQILQQESKSVRLLAVPLTFLLLIITCGHLLTGIDWTQATGRRMTVRLIQGNLPQLEKFSVAGLKNSVATYVNFAAASTANLTVLPETVFPIEWHAMPDNVKQAFQAIAGTRGTSIVIGTVIANDSATGTDRIETNSAIVVTPQTTQAGIEYRYDKQHLLPFGEYFPTGAKWIGPILNFNFSALTAGKENQKALILPQGKLGLSICFEDLFDIAIARRAVDANALLNISNFAWFANSYAPDQHLQVAQMRALETGRWFMQASNTGMTAVIDNHGVVQDAIPKNRTDALDAEIALREGMTPFMRTGNAPMLLISLLAIVVCGWRRYRHA